MNETVSLFILGVVLTALLSVIGGLTLVIFNKISADIGRMSNSVEAMGKDLAGLNTKLATVVIRVEDHGDRITKIEEKIGQ